MVKGKRMEKIDFQVDTINLGFSYRVVALIIKDNKLLAAKHVDHDCYYTVGGRVRLYETSLEAVVREAFEETGCIFEIDRLAFVQERFNKYYGKNHHEIVFFYLMKGIENISIKDGAFTDQQEKETLHWLPIEELTQIDIVPEFLKTSLLAIGESIVHIISKE